MVGGSDSLTLHLNQSMALSDASAFHDTIKGMIGADLGDKIVVNCVVNEVIDISTLQLLACLVKKAKSSSCKIIWDNPSIALFEASAELGLDAALGL